VTVALLRDAPVGGTGIEAWLLTRVAQMVFAAGMTVFPGGGCEPRDGEVPIAGSAAFTAARFGCTEDEARMLLGTAVREVSEETDVLLTDTVELRPFARWVTPPSEARRYDTRFFLAELPAGAQPRDITTESSIAAWIGAGDALAELAQGARFMLPPTRVTLEWLAGFASVKAALAAVDLQPIRHERPTTVYGDGHTHTTLADGRVIKTHRPDRPQK
jgi:8-oxo-dGTP pyrophosphatase MutT (NUDIX family)